jgi:hypothetical protein
MGLYQQRCTLISPSQISWNSMCEFRVLPWCNNSVKPILWYLSFLLYYACKKQSHELILSLTVSTYCELHDQIPLGSMTTRASTALNWSQPINMHNRRFCQSQFCKLCPGKSSCQKPSGPWQNPTHYQQEAWKRVQHKEMQHSIFLECVCMGNECMWLFCYRGHGVHCNTIRQLRKLDCQCKQMSTHKNSMRQVCCSICQNFDKDTTYLTPINVIKCSEQLKFTTRSMWAGC